MGRLALILLAGCGRIAFDPRADAANVDANAADDLLLWFPFDVVTPSGTPDASGLGHDGMCTIGTCPVQLNSARGPVMQFDGNSDLLDITSTADLQNLASFTIMLWVRHYATPLYGCIAGAVYGAALNSWHLCADVSASRLFFFTNGGAPAQAENAITAGTWHHIAMRWYGQGQTNELLVDGSVRASSTSSITWDGSVITIGGDIDGTPTAFFLGEVDEFRIYRRALADTEIAAIATL